jgi:hypothetical protein
MARSSDRLVPFHVWITPQEGATLQSYAAMSRCSIIGCKLSIGRQSKLGEAMDLARSVAALLTWQWLILIVALIFNRPLRNLIARISNISFDGERGMSAKFGEIGNVIEARGQERVEACFAIATERSEPSSVSPTLAA